jgi:hypothetical protein
MSTADRANVVNTWFSERLASGVLARDTPAYNQVVCPSRSDQPPCPPSVPDPVAKAHRR